MPDLFGNARTVVKLRYALFTPEGFGPSHLPGWTNAVCVVNISPALGARFTQMLVTLGRDGAGEGNTGPFQHFLYVVEGSGTIGLEDKRHRLEPGSYVYLPPGRDMQVKSGGAELKLLSYQKPYQAQKGTPAPTTIVSHVREVKGLPFRGNEAVRLQRLLPDQPAFDLAVNLFTYQPGATTPTVEATVKEHGLLMLQGKGIYRLDSDWYPVQAGDALWLGPYCPQWFAAIGNAPTSYICYQDVNRDPM